MAGSCQHAFSHSGEYLAVYENGTLKIWETASNRLKQEFVPREHLASPNCVLTWLVVGTSSTSAAKKRKRRSNASMVEDATKEIVAMGLSNGNVTLYDLSTASISATLFNNRKSSITAITWSPEAGLFSADADQHITQWSVSDKSIKQEWKSGKDKVTSLCVLPGGESLLAGEKIIKWWDIESKKLKGTFSGLRSQVNNLSVAKISDELSYLVSSSNGDNYLSVWPLNQAKKDISPVATLTLSDEVLNYSIKCTKDGQIFVLSTTRSGNAQLFKYQANGVSCKPVHPILNVIIATDSEQKAKQIPILTTCFLDETAMTLAYGSFIALTIEKVVPDFSDKSQCLIRQESKKSKNEQKEAMTKVKTLGETGAQYLGPGDQEQVPLKRKPEAGSQLPLQTRLDNLSLDSESTVPGKITSKGDNMAKLLIQALHSNDKNLLDSVLFVKSESIIKNTVAKLPTQAIIPLVKELTKMLEGKTYACRFAIAWMKEVCFTHTTTIISHPQIKEAIDPVLNIIDAKLFFFPELMRLEGKVNLLTGQIAKNAEREDLVDTQECLLVYEDQDSSDEDPM
ncbi:WD repeat-containing protein 43 [Trichogramma pretiosum]|uniref:WD repeat-containing protein 43 n=1 Tax=Trichogramma pretiosum TaxID=7493 RepID=UPI0006C94D97|nr:WD repeat-containing protein 43 [Trichogramma pretiosum]XP_014227300.1 WD repeat-containing protein 43 [Trichogramma pretiosum]